MQENNNIAEIEGYWTERFLGDELAEACDDAYNEDIEKIGRLIRESSEIF